MKLPSHQLCKQFTSVDIQEIKPLGNGLINNTFLINSQYVLQQINGHVFPQPELIMDNLVLLNQHIGLKQVTKLKIPKLLHTHEKQAFFHDEKGEYWRALEFIERTYSKEQISHLNDAEQVGFALGHFHYLLSDIALNTFKDTLPGFHITPQYFQQYQRALSQYSGQHQSKNLLFCQRFIESFCLDINVLEHAKDTGLLFDRIIHGDPKLNNFLFDNDSNKIISLIDLDTVKPGLVHYDVADCLRSCCHIASSNQFDLDICTAILKFYFNEVGSFFTEQDYEFLYPAIQLMPFELGLRFLTDYLTGNKYFKVDYPEHNLNRAIAQFNLCMDIEKKEWDIREIIINGRKDYTH